MVAQIHLFLAVGRHVRNADLELAAFFAYLADLARCTGYRLLSSVRMQGEEGDSDNDQVNALVNRIRVDHPGQLRMETDRPVTQVCYEVGFNDVANFNRRFLEIKGMTPSAFRRQADPRFGRKRP